MPIFWFGDDYPSRELLDLRAAWRAHYIAKGCSAEKAGWLAKKKTHTWPGHQ
jgi:hypothetical protein